MIIEQFHDHIKLALLYGENTKCQVIFFVMIVLIRCWIVAVNNANRNLNLLDLTYSSQSIIGSGGYRPEDVTDVMNIMKSGRWNIEKNYYG